MTAGERARELAAQLDLLEYGPEHRGFYDIEGAAKLIERALAAVRLEEAKWWAEFAILTQQHTRDCTFNSSDGPVGDYCDCGRSQRLKLMRERWQKLERAVEGK